MHAAGSGIDAHRLHFGFPQSTFYMVMVCGRFFGGDGWLGVCPSVGGVVLLLPDEKKGAKLPEGQIFCGSLPPFQRINN